VLPAVAVGWFKYQPRVDHWTRRVSPARIQSFDSNRMVSESFGWVTKFHLASDRNYAAVEGWNLVNDVGWYMVARHLGKRSDWIGKCAPGLNFGRGIVHLNLGIGNFIALRHHRNPNTLDLYVPKDSNYSEPRWWGKN
jgi:hypothetical protein